MSYHRHSTGFDSTLTYTPAVFVFVQDRHPLPYSRTKSYLRIDHSHGEIIGRVRVVWDNMEAVVPSQRGYNKT